MRAATNKSTQESSYYLVAGADLQFGVERHENRRRGQSNEQKGDGHGDVLRPIPVHLRWYAQNRDSRYKTTTNRSYQHQQSFLNCYLPR
jgi:hypothetical protein